MNRGQILSDFNHFERINIVYLYLLANLYYQDRNTIKIFFFFQLRKILFDVLSVSQRKGSF